MFDYVSLAACRGLRPKPLGGLRLYQRSDLVLQLASNRLVPRFLVAPPGSGKTMLACMYAETMFSLNDVFWFDCKSPCFLRDLDKRDMDKEIAHRNPDARLVVFDDVPSLSPERMERFWAIIGNLTAAGCETLVAVTPGWFTFCWLPVADACGWNLGEYRVLFASDLEVSDTESFEAPNSPETSKASRLRRTASRVPVYVWGRPGEVEDALRQFVQESIDPEMTLLVLVMAVLGEGDLPRVLDLLELPDNQEIRQRLFRDYPQTGASHFEDGFFAMPVELETAVRQLSFAVSSGRTCWQGSRDLLMIQLCDELLLQKQDDRACQVARFGLPRPVRTEWLHKNNDELLMDGCLEAGVTLAACCRTEKNPQGAAIHAREAWRLALLGETDDALIRAVRSIGAAWATPESRVVCALALVRFGTQSQRQKGLDILRENQGTWQGVPDLWRCLGGMVLEIEDNGLFASLQFWMMWAEKAEFGAEALIMAAAWVLREVCQAEDARLLQPLTCDVREFVRVLQPLLEADCEQRGIMGLFALEAFREMGVLQRRLGLRDALPEGPSLRLAAAARIRDADISAQIRQAGDLLSESPDAGWESRSLREENGSGDLQAPPPMLSVRLFGCVSVEIGGSAVGAQLLRRRKVQTLLVLLVLESGHAVSVSKLAESLWPGRDAQTARRNFYATWAELKRALTLPQGDCPYLIRLQGACKLDERWLVSDVQQVEEFCRTLHVDTPDPEGWLRLLVSFEDVCASELCPNEQENEIVRNAREAYSARIVDALVTAGNRLLKAGEPQSALWFARRAFARTSRREDVYMVLMRAQLAAGQRTMALETYMKCLHFLSDELGIDPSVEMRRLYEEVLECFETEPVGHEADEAVLALEPLVPPATFVRCSSGHASASSPRRREPVPSHGKSMYPAATIR